MRVIFLAALVLISTSLADGQTRRRTKTTKPAVVTAEPSGKGVESVVVKTEPKKNERPAARNPETVTEPARKSNGIAYYYEFSQPEFEITNIVIEHDDTGKGKITFTKRMFRETVSDPLQVSAAALERIDAAYQALNFLESNESYQHEKDFSHLGVSTFRLKKGDRARTTVFNYTTNKDAKALADEYRRIANQFIWVFDITLARENQPLESPRLLDALDALFRRNEISDPVQMVPLLNDLTNDVRIPLIARNHARKLVERIEKKK